MSLLLINHDAIISRVLESIFGDWKRRSSALSDECNCLLTIGFNVKQIVHILIVCEYFPVQARTPHTTVSRPAKQRHPAAATGLLVMRRRQRLQRQHYLDLISLRHSNIHTSFVHLHDLLGYPQLQPGPDAAAKSEFVKCMEVLQQARSFVSGHARVGAGEVDREQRRIRLVAFQSHGY